MLEAEWSARRVSCQLDHCAVRRCWDQWIRQMSFTRRPGLLRVSRFVSEQSQQTSSREDHQIIRNARVQLTASSDAIKHRLHLH
ncbi:uncharacterized protein TNCV_1224741 [Trichonephila clavipes]|nr:uncharacterized protein TNCV_1224741 [Trichonephila clavipes]